jgi:outer membrane protein OmpA-like peptidoglycan-associated protein
MRNNSVLFTPRLIADYRHQSGFIISLNLAYRLRAEAKFYDLSIGDELKLALGSEIPLFFQNLSIVGEIDMALGMLRFSQDTNRYLVADLPMELRMGLRWRHSSGFLVSLGGGIALTNGYSAPDVRVIVSLGWNHRFGSGRDAPQRSLGDAQADVQADAQKLAQSQSKPDKSADQAQQQAQASTRESASISGGSPVDAHTVHAPPASMPVPVKISDAQFDRAVEQDPDPDGDGIPSSIDKCPNEPEDFDGFQDEDGCPDGGKEQVRMVGSQLQIKDQILFQSGSAQLDDSALPILKQVASYLKVHQQIQRVRIEGHTDNRGDLEMNVDLSERRARAVMNVLLKEGIQASRLEAKGYGSTKAVADNKTAEGRRLNRRVVFEILPTNQPSQTSGGQK